MKVCFLHAGFSLHGGIERVLSIIVRNLNMKKNVEIHCLSLFESHPLDFFMLPSDIKINYLFKEQIDMKTAFVKGGVNRLIKYLKTNDINVIVACGAMYFPLACFCGKLTGTKVICWEHTNPEVKNEFSFQGVSRKTGAIFSDMNVLISKEAKTYYEKHFRKKRNIVIYNPVDNALFEKDACYDKESVKLISVGRLTYPKNYQLLIDIAEKLLDKNDGWVWHIYGDGEEREQLERIIAEKDLIDKVVLMGTVADIYDRYPEYAAIVMTSRYEGFPMVLLEAAAKGLPMISFDISTGPKEIIKDNLNGFLIPNGDTDCMLEKLDLLLNDKELRTRFSAEAKRKAQSFGVDNIVNHWCELFDKIMSK